MTITYSVAGVPLDDPNGRWKLLKDTQVGSALSVRASSTVIPGMGGEIPGTAEMLDTPLLALKVKIYGSSYADMMANYGALLAILTPTDDVTVVRTVDGVGKSITARGRDVSPPEFSPAQRSVTITATFRLPGVFWRGPVSTWTQTGPSSGTAYEVTTLADTTAPVEDALILVTGPAPSPRIHCAGRYLDLDTTIAAGSKALVDCAAWTVRIGTGVTFAGGGTLASGVLSNSGGPYVLRLVPRMRSTNPTATRVQVAISATGMSSATKLQIQAAPADVV